MFIKVKVISGSKKEDINKKSVDSFEIKIKEKPEKGQANKAVISVLSEYFNIPKNKVRLIKGPKQKNKIFEVL